MSGVNQFQTFAEGGSANALTPAAYAALTTLVANGYQTGVANSQQINTTLRQAAFASAVLAGIISDFGLDALDNGDLADFKTKLLTAMGVPAGSMLAFGGAAAPNGFLLCTGAAISRTAYAKLFTAIGTTFGSGDGSTTFNIPDTRNRAHVGSGSLYAAGATGGSKDAIVVSHSHGLTIDTTSIVGEFDEAAQSGYTSGVFSNVFSYSGAGANPHTNYRLHMDASHNHTGSIAATGGSGVDNNMMPYFACPFIIKY